MYYVVRSIVKANDGITPDRSSACVLTEREYGIVTGRNPYNVTVEVIKECATPAEAREVWEQNK